MSSCTDHDARWVAHLALTRLEALQKIMTSRSHAVPARAAQESLRLLSTLEKDIPIMKALTNAHLKDRHWWQVTSKAASDPLPYIPSPFSRFPRQT